MSQQVKEKAVVQESALENPEVIVEKLSDFEHYLEKNKKLVSILFVALVAAVGGYFGYRYWLSGEEEEAQKQLFPAVYYFEADSLNKALKGDGNNLGLVTVAEDFGYTKAGKLAYFYIGAIYLKQGKFQEAIDNLKDFSSYDILISARANCLIGDAYLELNDAKSALDYYKKAALHYPNKFFSPRYLMKAALAQELSQDYSGAINSYTQIIEKFNDSQEAQDAKKLKARLEQMTAN
ncbi:MAG TPA: tetratricopeptide repeat protein [Catalimonadaceae bacterium]|nr:tetratricopeptide repeat protein [Catalimonadaceae bacterium]